MNTRIPESDGLNTGIYMINHDKATLLIGVSDSFETLGLELPHQVFGNLIWARIEKEMGRDPKLEVVGVEVFNSIGTKVSPSFDSPVLNESYQQAVRGVVSVKYSDGSVGSIGVECPVEGDLQQWPVTIKEF